MSGKFENWLHIMAFQTACRYLICHLIRRAGGSGESAVQPNGSSPTAAQFLKPKRALTCLFSNILRKLFSDFDEAKTHSEVVAAVLNIQVPPVRKLQLVVE